MTDSEVLSAILNRLDLLYALHLLTFSILAVVGVLFILYRLLIKFF